METEGTATQGADVGRAEESTRTASWSNEASSTSTTDAAVTPSTDTSDTSVQASEPSDPDDFQVDVSLDDVPATLRPVVEKQLKQYEKQFKGAYTKKTMALAEERRQREAEFQQLQQAKQAVEAAALDVLRNPDKLDAYRKLYGLDQQPQAANQQPIETVDDLFNAVEQRVANRLSAVENQLRATTQQTIAQDKAIGRWEVALDQMRQDSRFRKYEKIIIGMSDDAKYKKLYTGNNEKQVLSKVKEDFDAIFREDLNAAKTEGLQSLERKKTASTTIPGRTVPTTTTRTGPRTKEEVIAAVRSRYSV